MKEEMKIYLISQEVNSDYDTYSDAVVCAENKEDAKTIHPSNTELVTNKDEEFSDWATLKDIKVEYLGTADNKIKRGVICASFHEG